MKKSPKIYAGKTGGNVLNLFIALALLLFITACVCQSDRSSNRTDKNSNSQTGEINPDSNSSEAEKSSANKKSDGKKEDRGDFIVEHSTVENPRYAQIDREIKEDKVLEKAADRLNRSLILPSDIFLKTKDCGVKNAFFDPNDDTITICYELMEHFYRLYRSAGDSDEKAYEAMFDAIRFVFLHEVGHALIHYYELPITANEEDAADRCSAFICIEELGDDGIRSILSAADAFNIESKTKQPSERNMADEHLLQEQRFYNSLCMVYGSNQNKYAFIVKDGYLPEDRAMRCPNEYERTAQSWGVLLKPWRKE